MPPNPTPIIEIANLITLLPGTSVRCHLESLVIRRGEIVAVDAASPADGRHLLRILATLASPESGRYRFNGDIVALNDYRRCLSVKRRIGYVAADAAMISNRTLRENLLLSRFYYENDLSLDLDETVTRLCTQAGLHTKLHWRPSELSDGELQKAIMIREIGKCPAVMLIDRPENFMTLVEDDRLFNHLKNMIHSGTAAVFLSLNRQVNEMANRRLTLTGKEIRAGVTPAPT